MRAWALAAATVIGCAQIGGLDETTGPRDATVDTATRDAAIDARACTGGDMRVVDPATGHCYTYFTTPQNRNTARQMCAALGTGVLLASIQSATENDLITSIIGQELVFIGGNDEMVEGMFRWEDGSPITLTNWNATTMEPNNGLNMYEEDCIVVSGAAAGKWDDRPCAAGPPIAGTYGFVCERD